MLVGYYQAGRAFVRALVQKECPCSVCRGMAIRVWGGGRWMNHYTNKENLIEKVLDFDQLGGPAFLRHNIMDVGGV